MKIGTRWIVVLVLLGIMVWLGIGALFHQRVLRVVFLDVGQGDAVLIITPLGKQVLIDGGKYEFLESKVAKYLPWYDQRLDLVIATHPDMDHVGGLVGILRRYRVDNFLHSGLLAGAQAYQEVAKAISEKHIPTYTAQLGQVIQLDSLTTLQVLYPFPKMTSFEANEYSIILKVTYRNNSVLLTGDANVFSEQDMVDFYGNDLASDILKLGHHGSKTSSSNSFLKMVNPQYSVVSAGCDNSFGHPDQSVVDRVVAIGSTILSTCSNGDIVFVGDGRIWKRKNIHRG